MKCRGSEAASGRQPLHRPGDEEADYLLKEIGYFFFLFFFSQQIDALFSFSLSLFSLPSSR